MNLTVVPRLRSCSMGAVWYRAVDPRYLPTALNYTHTRLFASRYFEGQNCAAPFDIVYLAENPLIALLEVEACRFAFETGWIDRKPCPLLAHDNCESPADKGGRSHRCVPLADSTFDNRTGTNWGLERVSAT